MIACFLPSHKNPTHGLFQRSGKKVEQFVDIVCEGKENSQQISRSFIELSKIYQREEFIDLCHDEC